MNSSDVPPYNKQLQRTVTRRRAAAELRRYAAQKAQR